MIYLHTANDGFYIGEKKFIDGSYSCIFNGYLCSNGRVRDASFPSSSMSWISLTDLLEEIITLKFTYPAKDEYRVGDVVLWLGRDAYDRFCVDIGIVERTQESDVTKFQWLIFNDNSIPEELVNLSSIFRCLK